LKTTMYEPTSLAADGAATARQTSSPATSKGLIIFPPWAKV
jgi:hypothetical protein